MIDAYEVAAFAAELLAQSEYHREQDAVRYFHVEIFPAVNAGQAKIYIDERRRPYAMVTWAFLSEDVEADVLGTGRALEPDEWTCGDRLFFNDWITPYGHLREVVADMTENRFPDRVATSIRRGPGGTVRRVNRWTGKALRGGILQQHQDSPFKRQDRSGGEYRTGPAGTRPAR